LNNGRFIPIILLQVKNMKRKFQGFMLLALAGFTVFSCAHKATSDSGTGTSGTSAGDSSKNSGASTSVSYAPDSISSLKVMTIANPSVLAPSLIGSANADYQSLTEASPSLITESNGIFLKKLSEVKAAAPDVLLINGNLTYQGEKESHMLVASELSALKTELTKTKPNFRILLTPGASDINNSLAKDYSEATTKDATVTTRDDFYSLYKDVAYDDATEAFYTEGTDYAGSLAYSITVGDSYTFIVFDDANYSSQTDSSGKAISSYAGVLGAKQLNWAGNKASAARKKGQAVIGLANHSVISHFSDEVRLTYSLVNDYGSVESSLALNNISVVFTATCQANDVASYAKSSYSLVDIASNSSVLYPGSTRTVDFTHTYSYRNAAETLGLKSSIAYSTDITYTAADKTEKTILDLKTYQKDRALTASQITSMAQKYPYELLHKAYPDYNDTDFLKNALADKGITSKVLNETLQGKVGTPAKPLYLKDGVAVAKEAYSTTEYGKDKDGNAIDFDLAIDYGDHGHTSKDYRIIFSKAYFAKIFNTSLINTFGTDVVLYVTDSVMEAQIDDIISEVDTNLIKSDTRWKDLCENLIPALASYEIDSDKHTLLNLFQELAFNYLNGSESETGWVKTARDDIAAGKDSKILDGIINVLAEKNALILDDLFGYLDFTTLLDGTTSDNALLWAVAKPIMKASLCPLSKLLESSAFQATSKTLFLNFFTDEKRDSLGKQLAGIIDEFGTDTDVPDDTTTELTLTYVTARAPK
jgi:3',5'-cyclic AMP phosphodiesterase CpdA